MERPAGWKKLLAYIAGSVDQELLRCTNVLLWPSAAHRQGSSVPLVD